MSKRTRSSTWSRRNPAAPTPPTKRTRSTSAISPTASCSSSFRIWIYRNWAPKIRTRKTTPALKMLDDYKTTSKTFWFGQNMISNQIEYCNHRKGSGLSLKAKKHSYKQHKQGLVTASSWGSYNGCKKWNVPPCYPFWHSPYATIRSVPRQK